MVTTESAMIVLLLLELFAVTVIIPGFFIVFFSEFLPLFQKLSSKKKTKWILEYIFSLIIPTMVLIFGYILARSVFLEYISVIDYSIVISLVMMYLAAFILKVPIKPWKVKPKCDPLLMFI